MTLYCSICILCCRLRVDQEFDRRIKEVSERPDDDDDLDERPAVSSYWCTTPN